MSYLLALPSFERDEYISVGWIPSRGAASRVRTVDRHGRRTDCPSTGGGARSKLPGAGGMNGGCYSADIIFCVSQRGIFITFEGLDGCGKSTQVEMLAEKLRAHGLEVTITREPGGTAISERIRALLLDTRLLGLEPTTELALMFAARTQHVHEILLPALDRGHLVLCDRFIDSSEAYQGGGRKLGSQMVLDLDRALGGNVKPDLTILLDCDVNVSVERARRRNRERAASADESRFERENRAFFTRVNASYHEIARREPERVAVVDARGTPEQTHATILAVVNNKLALLGRRRIQNAG